MAHRGRLAKNYQQQPLGWPYKVEDDVPDTNKWIRMIPAVEKCAQEMEALMLKYGAEVFGVNISIFHENLPGKVMMNVERYRYLNTKIATHGQQATTRKLFRP